MKRKLIAILSSAMLLVGMFGISAAPVAAVCGTSLNQHIIVARSADDSGIAGTYLKEVTGQAYARTLDPVGCLTYGGTVVLPANIENTVSGSIWQLGYGTLANGPLRFVYAMDTTYGRIWPSTTYLPIVGHNYKFDIRTGTLEGFNANQVVMRITDTTAGTSSGYAFLSSYNWSSNNKLAWWGGERLSSLDDIGVDYGETSLILHHMGYRTDGMSVISYRSGMTSSDVKRVGSPPSNMHGHIVTWTYGADGLQLETH